MDPSHRPSVDVVIAIHTPERNLDRSLRSVVQGNGDSAHAIVVCHNVAVETILATIPRELAQRAEFIEYADGHASPAGPFNAGITASRAPWVSVLGSDDSLDDGAVDHWLVRAAEECADAVIARVVRGPHRSLVRSPPTRPFKRSAADLTRDRLAYRSAPLGLISRAVIDRLDLEFTPGLLTGEDLAFSTKLWAAGRVVYAGPGPGYVEHSDALSRVSSSPRPVIDDLCGVRLLVQAEWFLSMGPTRRRAVVVKLLRRQVMDAVAKRRDGWSDSDRTALASVVRDLLSAAPDAIELLSIRERRVIDLVLDPETTPTTLQRRHLEAGTRARPTALLTRNPVHALNSQAPLRYGIAALLLR